MTKPEIPISKELNKAPFKFDESTDAKSTEVKAKAAVKNMVEKIKGLEPTSEEVAKLQKEVFNIKFNYDTLLNFTCQLLTHEQHVLFAAKKKEIFG